MLVTLALVIWWFFSKRDTGPRPDKLYPQYRKEHSSISRTQEDESDNFIEQHVTFEGGPEAFKKLHKTIRDAYAQTFKEVCIPKAGLFSAKDMPEYVRRLNEVPSMYMNDMTSMYRKYGIPESLRNKHMNLINSHHQQIMQTENKWYKIMEPFFNNDPRSSSNVRSSSATGAKNQGKACQGGGPARS